jgi:hypothetical protein
MFFVVFLDGRRGSRDAPREPLAEDDTFTISFMRVK